MTQKDLVLMVLDKINAEDQVKKLETDLKASGIMLQNKNAVINSLSKQLKDKNFEIDRLKADIRSLQISVQDLKEISLARFNENDSLNQLLNSQALEIAHLQQIIQNYQRLTLHMMLDPDKDNSKDFEEDGK